MQRLLTASALAVALAIGAATAPAQALPAQGLTILPADEARAMSVVDKAGWRRWRRVGWHRHWWRRWRRW